MRLRSLTLAVGTTIAAVGLAAATTVQASGGPPQFGQQNAAHATNVSTLTVKPPAAVTAGDRLLVEVGVWSGEAATTASVTDSAGDVYTELTHFTASDNTELSVWTTQVASGGGTIPTVTAKPTSPADVGVAVLEYSGVSAIGAAAVVDVQAHAGGTTKAAGTVAAGATAPTTAAGELALGFYADSGFGNALTSGAGFTSRADVSHTGDMELLAEDQLTAAAGATPNATFGTGTGTPSGTVWLAATIVLKAENSGAATAPGAPTGLAAVAGNGSARLSWTAPADGGSPITSYTITPYADGAAGSPTTVTGTPPATSTIISAETNAVPYTFTVTATNAVGTGPVSQASNTVVPDPVPDGQFGALQTWPIVAVHSVVLNDGKLLQWDGWETPEPTELYDPAARTFTTITAPSSIFCAGNAKLPDGRVLAVGGEPTSSQDTVTTGTLPAEIWDPATKQWTTIGSIAAARNYHSTAVLQPDGTVLIAGGGHEESSGDPGQFNAQVYSPSYLFNGPRPTITQGPGGAAYGATMTVTTPDASSIAAVNLVSFAADTHQSDMDQHFVPLSFTAGSGTLSVQAAANGAIAPPGDYMLFIVNKAGVPSMAATVHLSAAAPSAPGAPTAVTATPGSSSANVSWTAPASGGAPITSYTVTPYANGSALTPTTVTGNPPATSTTISGLTNGTSYTFTVTATDSAGTGPASAPSNAVVPTNVVSPVFVQQASTHLSGVATAGVPLGTPITVGNRLVVEVGVWNTSSATATGVTDSAGNVYSEVTHFTASDHTEMSVWSAPITAGGGTNLP